MMSDYLKTVFIQHTRSKVHFMSNFQGTLRYRMIGDNLGTYYFRVDELTGIIYVRNNLRTGLDMAYTVSMMK